MKEAQERKTRVMRQGFTLIELLLATGVLTIVAGVAIYALDPIKQLIGVQSVGRALRAQQIEKAFFQYVLDRSERPGDRTIAECTESNKATCSKRICRYGKTAGGCVNIDELIPRFIPCMPYDEAETNANYSGYRVYLQGNGAEVYAEYEDQNVTAGGGCEPFPDIYAHWKLDETDTSSQAAADDAGSNDGTYQGANRPQPSTDVPTSVEFAFDNTLSSQFDSDDHILITDTNADVPGNDLSITAWIRWTDDTIQEPTIIAKSIADPDVDIGVSAPPGTSTWWMLGLVNGTNRLRLRINDGATVTDYERGKISTNTWTHVAGTYNGSQMCLYKDGKKLGCKAQPGVLRKGAATMWIGDTYASAGGNYHFDGLIDDVRIYPLPLSAGQIEVIATGGT